MPIATLSAADVMVPSVPYNPLSREQQSDLFKTYAMPHHCPPSTSDPVILPANLSYPLSQCKAPPATLAYPLRSWCSLLLFWECSISNLLGLAPWDHPNLKTNITSEKASLTTQVGHFLSATLLLSFSSGHIIKMSLPCLFPQEYKFHENRDPVSLICCAKCLERYLIPMDHQ